MDLTLEFPAGELSLVAGRLGSGKTLLLLGTFHQYYERGVLQCKPIPGLLGEADVLTGQVIAPRTPPNALASFTGRSISRENWVVPGTSAYVPQSAWLQNASIRGMFGIRCV
jgi:hypothetical protein